MRMRPVGLSLRMLCVNAVGAVIRSRESNCLGRDTYSILSALGKARRLLQLLEDFRSAKVVAALDDAAKLERDAARGIVLTVLGRGHESVARLCEELGGRLENFLTSVEAELASEAMKYGTDPLQE